MASVTPAASAGTPCGMCRTAKQAFDLQLQNVFFFLDADADAVAKWNRYLLDCINYTLQGERGQQCWVVGPDHI